MNTLSPRCSLVLALALLSPAWITPTEAHAEDPERVVMKLDEFLKLYESNKTLAQAEKSPRDHARSWSPRGTPPPRSSRRRCGSRT